MEIVALCRIGFEKEVAAELVDVCGLQDVAGYVKAKADTGYVQFVVQQPEQAFALLRDYPFEELIFIRHWFLSPGLEEDLNPADRVTPLKLRMLPFLADLGQAGLRSIESIVLDTNDGKALSRLAKGVAHHLHKAMVVDKPTEHGLRGQLVFTSGQAAFTGLCFIQNVSPWTAGVPRLRLAKEAPSRATLKLEEAWHHFIPAKKWDTRLAPSMKAVDLGAAPGGWTWQLVRRSMFVDAVDNGPMAPALMDSGQVRHHLVDGFAYQPAKPVDWLVCDIADKPSKVASMIARWGRERWCSEAVFNLKLPMKQRYQEVHRCKAIIVDALEDAGIQHQLRFKQLYHDREEVTGHLQLF